MKPQETKKWLFAKLVVVAVAVLAALLEPPALADVVATAVRVAVEVLKRCGW